MEASTCHHQILIKCVFAKYIIALVFPLHPRTRSRIESLELMVPLTAADGIHLTESMSYIPFMNLVRAARLVITDSGGLQDTTERPITLTQGTNKLAKTETLQALVGRVLAGDWPQGRTPELWDGQTAARVARSLRTRID